MEWLEFSDIIGIAIVIYVTVLALNNFHIKGNVKLGILFSGISLAILYVFDMSWYVLFCTLPQSPETDFVLNFITCIVYLMIPVGLSTFFTIYVYKMKKPRHFVGLFIMLILAVADIANIFSPIVFYHQDSIMYYKPFGLVMHILCFISFTILLGDMTILKSSDYEDTFLAGFVGVTMLIGLLASWINYDLKTLWVGLGISYLLMYLAISELYNKKDVITGLPNRNAYEKAMHHKKDNYSTILMIDMNGLKTFNDTKGHQVGDQYINATAKTLESAYKGHGKLYRVGGDEFCLISNESKDCLSQIADALLSHGRCDAEYGDFPIDFAYGIGERLDGDSPSDVYNKADRLMYQNKSRIKKAR